MQPPGQGSSSEQPQPRHTGGSISDLLSSEKISSAARKSSGDSCSSSSKKKVSIFRFLSRHSQSTVETRHRGHMTQTKTRNKKHGTLGGGRQVVETFWRLWVF